MITFVINYHGEDVPKVEAQIGMLRSIYGEDTKIFILGDGVNYLGGTRSVTLPALKTPENGGAWTHRYLKYYLANSDDPCLIKIDPDTEILSAAENLPEKECIFCRVRDVHHGKILFRFPAGGALGVTRNMAQKIVAGEWFLHPRYRSDIRYLNYNDLMLRDIVEREKLLMVDRTDFCCGGRVLHSGAAFYHK